MGGSAVRTVCAGGRRRTGRWVGDLAKLGADLAAVRAEAAAAVARADAAERARDVAEAERDHWRRMAETLAADRPKPRWRLRWPWELSE